MLAGVKSRLTKRPSPSIVVALIAVSIALAGTAIAGQVNLNNGNIKANSIGGGKLKNTTIAGTKLQNDTITGAKVNESTLGQVPSAANANALGGRAADEYARKGTEVHLLGAAGEPTLQNSWVAVGGYPAPGFVKDQFGFVHLEGAVNGAVTKNTIFTLPVGFRPTASTTNFPITVSGPVAGVLQIDDGDVFVASAATGFVDLDGISFRAG